VLFRSKKIRTLHTYSREYDAQYRFNKLKLNKVDYPKKIVYKDKKLVDVQYEILLIKEVTDNEDTKRLVRNNDGKIIEETLDDPNWVIVDKIEYQIEETFNVTGANRKLTAFEVLSHLVMDGISENNPKQLLILNNKIIVEGNHLHMVTCKNLTEANRLYNYIRVYCFENKVQNIIFFGSISKRSRKEWYKKLFKHTGIKYNRLYRSCSR
jgi:hypothetical protein